MTCDAVNRPPILFGMLDGMVEHLFSAPQLARLDAMGRILDHVPIASWDDPRADAQNIHFIMFHALVRRIGIVANTRIDAFHLVRGNASTHPGTTQ